MAIRECVGACGKAKDIRHAKWTCDDCRPARRKAALARNRAKRFSTPHENTLYSNHRMDVYDYALMHAAQGGKCAGCGSVEMPLHVDHDHSCDHNGLKQKTCSDCRRGLLCGDCNRALGLMKDSPEVMRRLADYVAGAQ